MIDPVHCRWRRLALAVAAIPICLLFLSLFSSGWASALASPAQAELTPPATPAFAVYLPELVRVAGTPTPYRQHLPYLGRELPPAPAPTPAPTVGCPTTSTAQWGQMEPYQRYVWGAGQSPDLNLDIRGWYLVHERLGYASYSYPEGEPPDRENPLYLSHILPGSGESSFANTYQINEWDWWGCNCGIPRNPWPYPATMLGLRSTPGQAVHAAHRNKSVGYGFVALVLYADGGQIALKYTGEDRVDNGYLLHLQNLCVDPNLVALYRRLDGEGRRSLPGISNDSVIGVARGEEVRVVVRDSGSFLDPRSWQDWWQDQPPPARKR